MRGRARRGASRRPVLCGCVVWLCVRVWCCEIVGKEDMDVHTPRAANQSNHSPTDPTNPNQTHKCKSTPTTHTHLQHPLILLPRHPPRARRPPHVRLEQRVVRRQRRVQTLPEDLPQDALGPVGIPAARVEVEEEVVGIERGEGRGQQGQDPAGGHLFWCFGGWLVGWFVG